MVAKVLNIIFAAANLLVATQNLIPGLFALLSGHLDLMVFIAIAIGAGIDFTVIAMIFPSRLLGCSIHLYALSLFSTIFMTGKCLMYATIFLWHGFLFEGTFLLFFACSLAWGLWFVYRLVRIKKTRIDARRIMSR